MPKKWILAAANYWEILHDLDVDVTSHMSTIKEETAELVKGMFTDTEEYTEEEEKDTIVKKEKIRKSSKKKRKRKRKSREEGKKQKEQREKQKENEKDKKAVEIEVPITVKEYAELVKKSGNEIIKALMGLGLMAGLNHSLDEDTIIMLSDEIGVEVEIKNRAKDEEEDIEKLLYGPVGPKLLTRKKTWNSGRQV